LWLKRRPLEVTFSNSIPNQPSATSPLFFDNLDFEHFDKSANHESRLIFLAKKYKTEYRTSTNRTEIVGEPAVGN